MYPNELRESYKDSNGYHNYPILLKNGSLQVEVVNCFHNARTTVIAKRVNDDWVITYKQLNRAC